MHLTRLTLEHFRTYTKLSLPLTPGLTLIQGDNATGKSNLTEAVHLLAATRSARAGGEGEMIAWDAPAPLIARVEGDAVRADGPMRVEIAIAARLEPGGRARLGRSGAPLSSKRLRLNGVPRRAADVAGQIAAVLFSTQDIEILTGSPAARRRYLDFALAQAGRGYAPTLSRYERTLTQRNALLRRIGQGLAGVAELDHWDATLATEGGRIFAARAAAVRTLAPAAEAHHARIADPDVDGQPLQLAYRPALRDSGIPDDLNASLAAGLLADALQTLRPRETAAGLTLVGPHRDDLGILIAGRPIATFGSRAQQRSAALALRLAEAGLIHDHTGEAPVLLLDDVFSELDPPRRNATARSLEGAQQIILTTADPEALPAQLPTPAAAYCVRAGSLEPLDTTPARHPPSG